MARELIEGPAAAEEEGARQERPVVVVPARTVSSVEQLAKVVSPVVMGLVFLVAVTPTGWLMRLRGKDLLSLKRRKDLDSYWIVRDGPPPAPESMKQQF